MKQATVLWALAVLLCGAPARAQSTTTEGLTLRDTLSQMLTPVGSAPVGDAIAAATSLEVATAPFGTSSGGFVYKLDPSTGLRVRTAPTFGPSFAERALTAGEGKMSIAANLTVAGYDNLNKLPLSRMELGTTTANNAEATRHGLASLVLSSETLVLNGAIGATDNLDIALAVPFVKVKLDGISWVENGLGTVILRAEGAGESSGLGDIGVGAKLRVAKFGEGPPDPGGIALMLMARLPTGSRDNFRGLGITRVLGNFIISSGKGKFRPHGNVGFEWWEKGLVIKSGFTGNERVEARHQIQYAIGMEYEAGPKMTLLADVLGRHILGSGEVGFQTIQAPPNAFGVTSITSALTTRDGIQKLTLAPGIKWNLKGSFVLAFNSLIPLYDNGLHDKFTPVVGLDWTF